MNVKSFRDPVHNLIAFEDRDRLLVDLINAKEVQRMRRIRQLGLSNIAYPGAEHSRFVHSLGVAHLMRRFLDGLLLSSSTADASDLRHYRSLALAAALLHDIGHGPFSHALEMVTGERHEQWTVAVIESPDSEVHQILEGHETGLASLAAEVIERNFAPSRALVKLLSSQLDVDRMDYLLRDAMMTGAGYGTFDVEWLLHVMRIGEVDGETEVGLDLGKGQSIAEDYIMCRYYMYRHVYFHHTTRAAEVMVEKLLRRAREIRARVPGFEGLQALLDAEFSAARQGDLQPYLELDDSVLWAAMHIWSRHEDPVLADLATRLLNRKIFRAIDVSNRDERRVLMEQLQERASGHGLHADYYVAEDLAGSSGYKSLYASLADRSGVAAPSDLSYPNENIFMFDDAGRAHELARVSFIVQAVRERPVSIARVFAPEELTHGLRG